MKILAVFLLAMSAAAPAAFAQEIPATLSEHPQFIKRDLPEIQPKQEVRVGIFRLHPSLEASVEYDDNIHLSDSGEKEDVIFREIPGMNVEVRPGDHRLTAGYWAEILNFADTEEENAVNHIAQGTAQLDLGHLQIGACGPPWRRTSSTSSWPRPSRPTWTGSR